MLFTWVIISSDKDLSVNLRYEGDPAPTTPPVSVAATAITKGAESNTR